MESPVNKTRSKILSRLCGWSSDLEINSVPCFQTLATEDTERRHGKSGEARVQDLLKNPLRALWLTFESRNQFGA